MFNAICLGFYGLQEDIITSVNSNIHIYMHIYVYILQIEFKEAKYIL